MIFGYLSGNVYREVEEALAKSFPAGKATEFKIGERRAFFFHLAPNKFNKLSYKGDKTLVLCDGAPVRQTAAGELKFLESLDEADVSRGADQLLDTIASTVSMIYFRAAKDDAELVLASDRASAGKMYYRRLEDGIAFSNDFSQLLKFGDFRLDETGAYAIIRYGACPAPLTISRNIQSIAPCHYAVFDLDGNQVKAGTFFQFDFPANNDSDLTPVSNVLDSSARLLNGLGASALLSGGIDSTLLVHSLTRNSGRKLKTYHLNFGNDDPELGYAREAARITGCELEVISTESGGIRDTLLEMGRAYVHPFNDHSAVPTYYLIRQAAAREKEALIVDGQGGDESFGLFTLPGMRQMEMAFSLPGFLKAGLFNFYAHSDPLGRLYLGQFPRVLVECHRKDFNLLPLALSHWTTLFQEDTRKYESQIEDILTGLYTRLLVQAEHNRSHQATMTTAFIAQVTCGMWCAKNRNLPTVPNVESVFPYVWKNMIQVQSQLSWAIKTKDGIKKWPMRKLLSEKFPASYIYSRKRGFAPPFQTWFSDAKVHALLCDTLLAKNTAVETVVDKAKLEKVLRRLPNTKVWPGKFCNFLWGAFFTELWIKSNVK